MNDDNYDKLAKISTQMNCTLDSVMGSLLTMYETDMFKRSYPVKKDQLLKFDSYTMILREMLLTSMQNEITQEERIRVEFTEMINSKESTILSLQKEILTYQDTEKNLKCQVADTIKRCTLLEEKIGEHTNTLANAKLDFESKLQDKTSLNEVLKEKCNELSDLLKVLKKHEAELIHEVREQEGLLQVARSEITKLKEEQSRL